jgi:hypothetical protein
MIKLPPQFVSGLADGAKALVVWGTNLTAALKRHKIINKYHSLTNQLHMKLNPYF